MSEPTPRGGERVRAAELIAALSLATDLGSGVPLEHGLESTLIAMRLGERLGVDPGTASQTFYVCMLLHVGCTADADVAAELFEDDVNAHFAPVMFGSRVQAMRALTRALAALDRPAPQRAALIVRKLPRAVREYRRHVAALCEVAEMLAERLGLPGAVQAQFAHLQSAGTATACPAAPAARRSPCRCGSRTSPATRRPSGCSGARSAPPGWSASERAPRSTRRSRPCSPTRRRRCSAWTTGRPGTRCSPTSPPRRSSWTARRSTGRWRPWATSPTSSARTWRATPPGWPSWRAPPPICAASALRRRTSGAPRWSTTSGGSPSRRASG